MTIGQRIKQVRQYYRLKQDEVAIQLFITKQTLSRYETGERTPDVSLIQRFIQLYKVDANWLLRGEGQMLIETDHSIHDDLPEVLNDKEIRQLLDYMVKIPKIRRSIMATFDQLRAIFEKDILAHEKREGNHKENNHQ